RTGRSGQHRLPDPGAAAGGPGPRGVRTRSGGGVGVMAGEIKLFGHQFKTWQVWTVGIGGGLATWYVIRQRQANAAAAATSAADSTVDPVTGLTDAQDIAQYGSVAAADAAYSGGTA